MAWNWGTLAVATVVYWLLVILGWVAWRRRSAKRKGPDVVRQISENVTEIVLTDEIEINLVPVVVVLLGPPLVGLILLLIG